MSEVIEIYYNIKNTGIYIENLVSTQGLQSSIIDIIGNIKILSLGEEICSISHHLFSKLYLAFSLPKGNKLLPINTQSSSLHCALHSAIFHRSNLVESREAWWFQPTIIIYHSIDEDIIFIISSTSNLSYVSYSIGWECFMYCFYARFVQSWNKNVKML